MDPTETRKDNNDNSDSSEPQANQANGDPSKMVQEENVADGADEQMLGAEEKEKLAEKREEVKFINGEQQNGEAKIDIEHFGDGKAFTGMTKEELMKYANDPFWVRLRWIFFIAFWAIWAAMLISAILIIVSAPKCAAPEPLKWFQRGLLAKMKAIDDVGSSDLAAAEKLQATGVIYELPAELTYSVAVPKVEQKIKDLVNLYKDSEANLILDITPNYVTKDSEMMQDALADRTKRSAFIWVEKPEVPNNWVSVVNGSAWSEVQSGNFVLSQFGDGLYDLHMNDTIVKEKLGGVLRHLVALGVKGFRMKNSKFYLISNSIEDEVPSNDPNFIHTQYGFWTHAQTTFQEGLGDVLYEYKAIVKNASAEAFLSVADDVVRPEVYRTSNGDFGIDMTMYGRFTHLLVEPGNTKLPSELQTTLNAVGNDTWLQWNFDGKATDESIDPSAYQVFMALLPGVPVVSIDSAAFTNVSESIFKHIQQLRLSPSYMHGNLKIYNNTDLAAYSRIKSGNPGYLVAYNPTDTTQKGNFSNQGLPEKMSVDLLSANFNVTDVSVKSKVSADSIEVSPFSSVVLTYVPIHSG